MNNTFIPYEKALSIIATHRSDFKIASRKLVDCIGAYLAEDLIADRDFPPFDRVTMDGIAIDYETFKKGQRTFYIETTAGAGTPQKILQHSQNCIEIMTGAILPEGVDTIIRYEDLEMKDDSATVKIKEVRHRQNIHFKGSDIAKNSVIVEKGKRLSSAEINVAATIGKANLKVVQFPKAVIISTGDELVPISAAPKLYQIRRSNSYGIQHTLKEWGLTADLAHLPDDQRKMHQEIKVLLGKYELLIFSGGVSAGKFDYVPEILKSVAIDKHFHKVQQRPGKPFWFGTSSKSHTIFALPGNPVSSFVCTQIYIKHWLGASLKIPLEEIYAELNTDIQFKPDLVYFLEASLKSHPNGKLIATPVKGNGSGDFANLVKTDGFLVLPQGQNQFKKGEVYPFVSYRTTS